MFMPYKIGLAHILSYNNSYETLNKILIESNSKASFCSTINDENPLSISVFSNHKSCIEICLKFMRIELYSGNSKAFMPLGNCLTQLTKLHIGIIPRLYEILYQENFSLHLPSFCDSEKTILPSLYYADDIMINIEQLLPMNCISTHGEAIVFFGSLCPINVELGSQGSIEFLESCLESDFPEIFRSRFLIVLLRHK